MNRYRVIHVVFMVSVLGSLHAQCAKTPQEALDTVNVRQEVRDPNSFPNQMASINSQIDEALKIGSMAKLNDYLEQGLKLIRENGKRVPLSFKKRVQKCAKSIEEHQDRLNAVKKTVDLINKQISLK